MSLRKLLRRGVRAATRRAGWGPRSGGIEQPEAWSDLAADEYVQHLQFVVGGFLDAGNVRAIDCALHRMPATGAVVEIGTFLGLSTNILAYALHKYGRTRPFFTCDPWCFAGGDRPKAGYFSTGTPEYREWVLGTYREATSLFSRGLEPWSVDSTSAEFFAAWRARGKRTDVWGRECELGGPIAFAYVDGAHTYELVRQDFVDVDEHLAPGGLILFDDSTPEGGYPDVVRVATEAARHPRYRLIMNAPNVLVQKMELP
jgi:hypothetical protein